MAKFDDFKLAVEGLSGGKNTVILDDDGMPSVMVPIHACPSSALDSSLPPSLDGTLHPAFRVGGRTHDVVYISKFQNIVANGRGYSLPLQDPAGETSYDDAIRICRAKGEGWGLTPAALWSAIALWCRKNGTLPRGNNHFGKDYSRREETGIVTFRENGKVSRVATGSGPATWYHDGTPEGIADLYGNVSEWCAGVRLVRGELQMIPDADSMQADLSLAPNSDDWHGILDDGGFARPGTEGTLKLDYADGNWKISRRIQNALDDTRDGLFRTMTYDPDELENGVPQFLKELTLFPVSPELGGYGNDYFYANNAQEERILLRGGNWTSGTHAGVFYSAIDAMRTRVLPRLGFRSAYYGPAQ